MFWKCLKYLFADISPVLLALIAWRTLSVDSSAPGSSGSRYAYTSFQPQLITCESSQPPLTPSTLADLQSIVHQALRHGLTLKPLGSLHSGTDIICTSGVPVSIKRITHFRYDPATGHVTAGAGMTLLNLLDKLHEHGRTLLGLPTYGDVTVGGALGVGTHGSGRLSQPGTVSDQVISLLVVDGMGEVRNISELELVRAFRTNLGLLGIVYQVVMETVAQYKLEIRHVPLPHRILWEGGSRQIMKYVRNSDRFQLWWYPTSGAVVLSVGTRVSTDKPGLCETHFLPEISLINVEMISAAVERFQETDNHLGMFALQTATKLSLLHPVPGKGPMFSEPHRPNLSCLTQPPVGFSHKMQMNSCNVCSWDHGNLSLPTTEFSVALPIEELHGALVTLRGILTQFPVHFPLNGIYIRFLGQSDGLMSINGGRDTVVIEWALIPRRDRFMDPMRDRRLPSHYPSPDHETSRKAPLGQEWIVLYQPRGYQKSLSRIPSLPPSHGEIRPSWHIPQRVWEETQV